MPHALAKLSRVDAAVRVRFRPVSVHRVVEPLSDVLPSVFVQHDAGSHAHAVVLPAHIRLCLFLVARLVLDVGRRVRLACSAGGIADGRVHAVQPVFGLAGVVGFDVLHLIFVVLHEGLPLHDAVPLQCLQPLPVPDAVSPLPKVGEAVSRKVPALAVPLPVSELSKVAAPVRILLPPGAVGLVLLPFPREHGAVVPRLQTKAHLLAESVPFSTVLDDTLSQRELQVFRHSQRNHSDRRGLSGGQVRRPVARKGVGVGAVDPFLVLPLAKEGDGDLEVVPILDGNGRDPLPSSDNGLDTEPVPVTRLPLPVVGANRVVHPPLGVGPCAVLPLPVPCTLVELPGVNAAVWIHAFSVPLGETMQKLPRVV
mmetsp:Transcript_7550/g.18338  ORF Transcript_7550/g.18338 Transcript_7550/m.18338 type:complete len:368 (+) Transcript_7550:347-1450(+)